MTARKLHFDHLLPETIFATVTRQGYRPTGAFTPLNSYENRVYEIQLEDAEPIVAKYYRPERWETEAIAEEHRFVRALADAEIPVVAPLPLPHHIKEAATLDRTGKIVYAFFPKFRGRAHDEIAGDDRRWLGRLLGRLHNIAASFEAPHRLALNPQTYGAESLDFILSQDSLPSDLKKNIQVSLDRALALVTPFFDGSLTVMPTHGDCHPGNILWNRNGPHLVDFDDMAIAPPVQDLWMLFYGTAEEKHVQQAAFFEGYETFRRFDPATLVLAEPLRTLRIIRHAAWIGQRYSEPAFRRAFPYYEEPRFWEEFLQSLKDQISLLEELSWT